MENAERSLLIIFYRNPELGKVKTRLAATVGHRKALEIFRKLSLHTRRVTENIPVDRIVFYTDAVDLMDIWPNAIYLKALQRGADLGEKMKNAFEAAFETGYTSVCIIGTDCYELSESIIIQAFEALRSVDAVIGPARDGGYYLLGMKKLYSALFEKKNWSTETVARDTIGDFEAQRLQYIRLPLLNDVDREDDLPEELRL